MILNFLLSEVHWGWFTLIFKKNNNNNQRGFKSIMHFMQCNYADIDFLINRFFKREFFSILIRMHFSNCDQFNSLKCRFLLSYLIFWTNKFISFFFFVTGWDCCCLSLPAMTPMSNNEGWIFWFCLYNCFSIAKLDLNAILYDALFHQSDLDFIFWGNLKWNASKWML